MTLVWISIGDVKLSESVTFFTKISPIIVNQFK